MIAIPSRLQFITPDYSSSTRFLSEIQFLLDEGLTWIQFRDKKSDDYYFLKMAEQISHLKNRYSFQFIINDRLHLVSKINADGVHLGQKDATIHEARKLLAPTNCIGLSTNSLAQVIQAFEQNADYIGLGPYQFTSTKDDLNPILGLDGFTSILEQLPTNLIHKPIFAIGGITIESIKKLKEVGISHFAISSALIRDKSMTKAILKEIYA